MDGYISKPIEPKELFETVEGVVSVPAPAETRVPGKQPGAEGFDEASLLARVGGDAKLLRTLVRVFLGDCPRMMSAIRRALAGRNMTALASAAHALKGSVSNFGAQEVTESARKLEAAAREGNLAAARETYGHLEGEVKRFEQTLHAIGHTALRSRNARGLTAAGEFDGGGDEKHPGGGGRSHYAPSSAWRAENCRVFGGYGGGWQRSSPATPEEKIRLAACGYLDAAHEWLGTHGPPAGGTDAVPKWW